MSLDTFLRQTRRAMVNLNRCPGCKTLKVLNVENMAPAARKRAGQELAAMLTYIRGGISARQYAASLINPVSADVFDHVEYASENFVFRIRSEHYDGC